jgi:NADH-quinone oxidoreductase subunit M
VGMIYERYHTRDINAIGGLWNRLPILAFFLILAALGSAAVPGLNGFVGEFPILVGTFETSRRTGVLAATGMVLGLCYLLWMVRKVLFGPLKEPVPHAAPGETISAGALGHTVVAPVGAHEIAGLAPLLFLIVAIGIYPKPVLEQMRPTLAKINQNTQARRAGAIAAVPVLEAKPGASSTLDKAGINTARSTKVQGAGTGAETQKGSGRPVEATDSRLIPGSAAPRTKDQEKHS